MKNKQQPSPSSFSTTNNHKQTSNNTPTNNTNTPHYKRLLEKELSKNNTVKSILGKAEIRTSTSFVELHKVVDNRYWVGYLKRGEEIVEELKGCI